MISPETLAQVARLLGVSEKRAGKMHDGRYVILKDGAFWYYSFGWSGAEQRMSDGDLLLACLTKAAEMGWSFQIRQDWNISRMVEVSFRRDREQRGGEARTLLGAVTEAFAALADQREGM